MEYAIQTKNLTKKDGNGYRVKNINLAVPKGCIYGFLGPNGAGKSTTLKMILGLVKKSSGEIYIQGKKITASNLYEVLGTTGSLIEGPAYYENLTGQENLEVFAKYKHANMNEIKNLLGLMQLLDAKDKKVKHYSLGMKQRLGIAIALLNHPKILILDEPTNGLDPYGIHQIREFIKTLPQRYQMTVIVSSHLLHEIEQMADYVGIIHHGHLVYQGEIACLKQQEHSLEDVFLAMTQSEQGGM